MPGNRRAADRLLTLSTPVEFPIQTAPALLLFHGAVFFACRGRHAPVGTRFRARPPVSRLSAHGRRPGVFFVWNAETARLQLTTVRLCGTITDGKRIWQGKSLGKRRLSPAEGAKLSGGPIGLGLKMDVALEKLIARTEGARRQRRISQVKGQSKEGGPLWASPVFFVLCMSWTAPLRVRLFFCARAPGPARLGNWEKRGKQEDGTNAERYRQCGE